MKIIFNGFKIWNYFPSDSFTSLTKDLCYSLPLSFHGIQSKTINSGICLTIIYWGLLSPRLFPELEIWQWTDKQGPCC